MAMCVSTPKGFTDLRVCPSSAAPPRSRKNHWPQSRSVALAWYFIDRVLPDSDVASGGMSEVAASSKAMAGSGEPWCLFADGQDELRALRSGGQDKPYGCCGKDVSISLHDTRAD